MEFFRGGLGPVVHGNLIGGDAETFEVFLESGNAFFIGVGAGEAGSAAEGCGDEKGFSSGSGAGIEDFFTGFGFEEFDAVAGGGILDVEVALREEFGGDFAF